MVGLSRWTTNYNKHKECFLLPAGVWLLFCDGWTGLPFVFSHSRIGAPEPSSFNISSYLPRDVVLRILSRLPPKSLLRFRSVCKSWLSLIGSADYVSNNFLNDSILTTAGHEVVVVRRTATSMPETQTFSFLSYETLGFASQTLEDLPIQAPPGISVVGCCNGLICLHEFFAGGGDIFVWNPATSELKALPCEFNVDTVCFGFDHNRNEFKVLRIHYVPDDPQQELRLKRQAEVYSLRSGSSWRKLIVDGDLPDPRSACSWEKLIVGEDVLDFSGPSSRPDLAYANGVCYWRTLNDAEDDVDEEKVIAFHFTDEVFRATPLLDASLLGGHTDRKALTVLNESVGMIVLHNESFDIWVLLEFGVMESWTRLLRVENFTGLGSPLGFWKKGELFMENSEGELVLYDRSLQTVRNLQVKGMKESLQVFGYTPSSISIEGGFKLSE